MRSSFLSSYYFVNESQYKYYIYEVLFQLMKMICGFYVLLFFLFQCLCRCLEFQFDHVISDRIMIIQRMRLLSNVLKEDKILTWDFFLSRLDTLSLEAQIDLENSGDNIQPLVSYHAMKLIYFTFFFIVYNGI